MHDVKTIDFSRIAQDLQIRKLQVESVVALLDEGNTVPFITRYRKERTGGLNEEVIRLVQKRVQQARALAERKETILKSIEGQGKLTDELRQAIIAAESPKRLEDLYLPFKPKKRTLATTARERGLEPLALAIWTRDPAVANLDEVLPTIVNPEKELHTPDDVRAGVQHILAELIADAADVRAAVRSVLWETGKMTSAKCESLAESQGLDYKDYFQFTESARQIPPHRILALNRGEKEGALKVQVESDREGVRKAMLDKLSLADHPHADFLKTVAEDALTRLVMPSLEREVRRELTDEAETHAVKVFARNLRSLLLQPPLHRKRVLAIDPGFRTGCKLAALDETGNLLEEGVIYPHPAHPRPPKKSDGGGTEGKPAPPHEEKPLTPAAVQKRQEARFRLEEMIRKHQLSVIAIGNGTACRETEELVSELIADLERRRHGEIPPTWCAASQSAPCLSAGAPANGLAGNRTEAQALSGLPPLPGTAVAMAAPVLSDLPVQPGHSTFIVSSIVPAVLPALEITPAPIVSSPTPESVAPAQLVPSLDSLPLAPAELAYVIVNEAGASVYSASPIGREEFPHFDATLRGTISIGRRLQDPLSELVKIEPQNIGVGLYQHDISLRNLKEMLDAVIESSVNHVGVDLNTASVPLLRHVSGLNQLAAREIVDFRKNHGPFTSREQLLQVPNIGAARFTQAAGFLKIPQGENPLDRTWIHPESYGIAEGLLRELGYSPHALSDKQQTAELHVKLKTLTPEDVANRLQTGIPTVRDILEALSRPGRDPREDLPQPVFKRGILKLEDLQPGMELKGTVLNVVDFGAFVDIGLKDSGLVHISQMANRYIKNPYDVVAVGDVVTVWVLAVDQSRRRVSLTMIRPGTERHAPERKPAERRPPQSGGPRPGGGSRPPRGRRPGSRPGVQVAVPGNRASAPPANSEAPAPADAAATGAQAAPPPPAPTAPSRPAPPPRRPHRQPAKAKLSQEALKGDTPLRTFSELKAFFEAKKEAPPETKEPEPKPT